MKKHFVTRFLAVLSCTLLLGLWSCSKQIDVDSDGSTLQTRTDNVLDRAVYHEGTDSWIRQRADPYTLENFQKAYNNLVSGKSNQILPKALKGEFRSMKLNATHYSVKFFPKTEDEQWKIETMKDIPVVYIPLNYVQLHESESFNLEVTSAQDVFQESGRYTVTSDSYDTTGAIVTNTFTMPILYAVWPCDKSFSSDIKHEIIYKIFLPGRETSNYNRGTGLSLEAMQILETEAINIALRVNL